jgi:hypothetical protein
MARKEVIQYVDDLTGEPLPSDEVRTVNFSYSGKDYTVDLSQENADRLREVLSPWLKVATRVSGRRASSKVPARTDLDEVRVWARENGFTVSERGRVAQKILDAYDAR